MKCKVQNLVTVSFVSAMKKNMNFNPPASKTQL